MIPINKKLIRYNFSSRNGQGIRYIVIHDTGNPRAGADAEAHFNYFNGGDRGASAHYFVDDSRIIQLVEDEKASWHCGDGRGKYGITNQNSLGVEICINADGNYNRALSNTLALTRHLLNKHALAVEQVVRHYDASGKICPATMRADNWARWWEFKQDLLKALDPELERAIELFVKKKLMDSPAYWRENARPGKTVNGEYAGLLLKRTAAYIAGRGKG
jgi:N-acetylmuramoyl-L-alanine amidase